MDQKDQPAAKQVVPANEEAPSPLTRTPASSMTTATSAPTKPSLPVYAGQMTRMGSLWVAFMLIVSLAGGFIGGWYGGAAHSNPSANDVVTKQSRVVLSKEGDIISDIAKTVGSSVVSVNVKGQASTRSVLGFSTPAEQESAGTGIILTEGGLIITNRHVVPTGTTDVSVTTSDGTTYDDVTVVGRTRDTDSLDVAFLKVNNTNGKKLTPATIGDSSKVKVGDQVVAIGNALGQFQNSVTSGIISGFGRSIQASDGSGTSSENLEGLFQTDAAINEGNSGGPLVNLSGEIVGINTAIAGNAQSIGFAIPINDVSGLIKSVEAKGKLERPYLGVVYVPITADIAKQYDLGSENGVYVAPADITGQEPIVAGSPAEEAGLQSGDIITKVDGKAIDQKTSLTSLLDKKAVGDDVSLTILRDGKTSTLKATLKAAPSN